MLWIRESVERRENKSYIETYTPTQAFNHRSSESDWEGEDIMGGDARLDHLELGDVQVIQVPVTGVSSPSTPLSPDDFKIHPCISP